MATREITSLTIRLEKDLLISAQKRAKSEDLTLSQVIRLALRKYISK